MTRQAFVVIATLCVLLAPRAAHAYIDPGTTQSLFAVLAPVIALFGVLLGYVLWPFRYVILRIFRKSKPDDDATPPSAQETPEPQPGEPPEESPEEQ